MNKSRLISITPSDYIKNLYSVKWKKPIAINRPLRWHHHSDSSPSSSSLLSLASKASYAVSRVFSRIRNLLAQRRLTESFGWMEEVTDEEKRSVVFEERRSQTSHPLFGKIRRWRMQYLGRYDDEDKTMKIRWWRIWYLRRWWIYPVHNWGDRFR